MAPLAIRAYEPADSDACARIFDRSWHMGHPYAPRLIDAALFAAQTRDERILVAVLPPHGVAGFVAVHEAGAFVHHLYVDPDFHGQGIGRALLARAVAMAGGTASLKCQCRNVASLAFYRHLGWTEGENGSDENGAWLRMHSPVPPDGLNPASGRC